MDNVSMNRTIARTALKAFGGEPEVFEYWDENKESSIDLLSTINRPYDGLTSYSTIGLSDYTIGYSVDEMPLRAEIVGACATEYEFFPNILTTCAFFIINSEFSVSPGKIFEDIIQMYYPDYEMKHVLFMSPFLWEDSLKTIDFEEKKVAWLLAVPISENEYLFAQEKGTEKLEELFEQEEIDILNLERRSTL